MNLIDIILIIPLVWFTYRGFVKGFIIEATSLVALVGGIYAGMHFSYYASNLLNDTFPNMRDEYVTILAFAITFVIVVIVVFLIGRLVEKLINLIALGFLNRLAGAILGLLKAGVLLSIILVIINKVDDDLISAENKQNSMLYGPVEGIAPYLFYRIIELDFFRAGDSPEKPDEVIEDV